MGWLSTEFTVLNPRRLNSSKRHKTKAWRVTFPQPTVNWVTQTPACQHFKAPTRFHSRLYVQADGQEQTTGNINHMITRSCPDSTDATWNLKSRRHSLNVGVKWGAFLLLILKVPPTPPQFESRPWHRPPWLRSFLLATVPLATCQDNVLPYLLLFIIH
jgi:hypothetical protein